MHRRQFLGSLAAAGAGLAVTGPAAAGVPQATRPAAARAAVRPRRLAAGDTVALVAPASATFRPVELAIARESLEALGFTVRVGGHLLDRHGYLAGRDADRARDINQCFADESVRAVLPIRGGWGSARVLPHLDFDVIAGNPKVLLGYSDITALLLAVHAKTGLVTFHGPNGLGRWDAFSVDHVRRLLFHAEAPTLRNLREVSEGEALVQTEHRVQTITPGRARGRLLGGNLTVLSAMVGSPYLPDCTGAILFLEDVREEIYRVDRLFTHLKLAGLLDRLAGFVFGTCAECEPGRGFGSLTLEEVFADHIRPLGIPAWHGAMIGHRMPQFTVPLGVEAEIDAEVGTIRLLEAAVHDARQG
jgi:muramoyltetrapeptide carboxypeptidase